MMVATTETNSADGLLAQLRAAADPTRLRLLALCAGGELNVGELVQILGQSQPRVSRHLRLLCEAGLLDRAPEGSSVFYRLTRSGQGADLAAKLVAMVPGEDRRFALDRARLDHVRRQRGEAAAAYFRENAAEWDRIRALHVDEAEVEAALAALLPRGRIDDLLDIGTGTGRLLCLLGPRAERATGVDLSREMLALARANLDRAGRRHCTVRRADMYQLPFADSSFDVVTVHQVLHFADEPATALAEAARVLRPGGTLVAVDFARHEIDRLRIDFAHRRLGFSDGQIAAWFAAAGLAAGRSVHLPGAPLTVVLWQAQRPAPRDAGPAARLHPAEALS